MVVGPSGIGKTRLLDELDAEADRRGDVVVRGSCLDIGDAWPLHPLREAANRLAKSAHPRMAEQLQATLDGDGSRTDRPDGLAATHRALSALASRMSVLVVLDDLQWMDRSTAQLIRILLSGLTTAPIRLLGAVRTRDPSAGPDDLLIELHRSPVVEVVEVAPLTEEATIELARSLAGRPISASRGRRLWERSGGVPLLVHELVADEFSTERVSTDTTAVLRARIDRLGAEAQEVVRGVSVGVGPIDLALLRSVTGRDEAAVVAAARDAVELGVLRAGPDGYAPTHDLYREAALETIPPPERASLHRRMAEAIEKREGPGALERSRRRDVDPIALAHHWAGAGDIGRALPAFVAAGRAASELGAIAESWDHWKVAAGLLADADDPSGAIPLLQEAAEAAHLAEDHDAALRLSHWAIRLILATDRAADRTAHDLALGTAELARARYLAGAGQLAEAEAAASAIAERADAGCARLADLRTDAPDGADVAGGLCAEPPACALGASAPGVVAAECSAVAELRAEAGARSAELLVRLGRYEEAVTRATSVLDRRRPTAPVEATTLLASAALGYGQACLGRPTTGRAVLSDALDRARRSGRLDLIEMAGRHYAELLLGPLNELANGVALATDQAHELVEQGADPRFVSALLGSATTGLFRLGRWADARRAATAALEADPTGVGVADLLLGRARVTMGLGDLDAAAEDLDVVGRLMGSEPNHRNRLPLVTLRAGLALWRGDVEGARAEIRRAVDELDIDADYDRWLVAPLLWHGLRAEAMAAQAAVGRAGEAGGPDETWTANLAGLMATVYRHAEGVAADEACLLEAYRLLCDGELATVRREHRPDLWARAATAWDDCGHPYPAAYARFREAEARLAVRTRDTRARELVRSAHAITARLDARLLQADVEDLARRARIDLDPPDAPPTAAPTPTSSEGPLTDLTDREREVLAEVATGRSNREIGERLYISGRTVGVHVSNILAKLGVATRVEAAGVHARSTAAAAAPDPVTADA